MSRNILNGDVSDNDWGSKMRLGGYLDEYMQLIKGSVLKNNILLKIILLLLNDVFNADIVVKT